jgi:hypothetical protein
LDLREVETILVFMYYFIRTFLFLISTFIFKYTCAQIVYDKSVIKQYQNLFMKLAKQDQKKVIELEKDTLNQTGFVIITKDKIDTLNEKESQPALSEITLIEIDPETSKPVTTVKTKKVESNNDYSFAFCYQNFKNDTLAIQIGFPFWEQALTHLIFKNRIKTFHTEYLKWDALFKANINDSLTNNLTIPAKTIKFILSDNVFKAGKTIFGSAEIITSSYFKKDLGEESYFYNLQRRMKYYFKFRVTKNILQQ